MNQVEMIAALCAIIDQQNVIIQDQATQLAQFDALTHAGEIAALRKKSSSRFSDARCMWPTSHC